jgi:hypothetical protein
MDASGTASKVLVLADGTKLAVTWRLFQEHYGTTINITSDAVSLLVYLVSSSSLPPPSFANILHMLDVTSFICLTSPEKHCCEMLWDRLCNQ